MDDCEGDFGDQARPTDKCSECGMYLRDHYWYKGLLERN